MLSPRDALAQILERVGGPRLVEAIPLLGAAGRILARPALSDVDLPPFEKSMMDGFAVQSGDLARAPCTLPCIGESRAGAPFAGAVPDGCCIEIYTGAELPAGCDAVVMVERTRREGAGVHFEASVAPGENVAHRSEILAAGDAVYGPGRRLSPVDLAVLAAIGLDPVPVFRKPRVSVLTTGDELVPASATPRRGEIREGNTLFLGAALEQLGCEVLRVGIVKDDPAELEGSFARALEEGDALVTTGGVSVGKYDLVGATFERLGVLSVLHKVAIKPGKPIWFGMKGARSVFGLPGNPVSSLLGFEVFVRPALAKMAGAGAEEQGERIRRGRWMGPLTRSSVRQHNEPARLGQGADGVDELHPLAWKGSADIVAVARADAFAIVPADGVIVPREIVEYRPLR